MVPHSHEAEQAVLGSILIDESCLKGIDLGAEDFFSEEHQQVFEAILALRDQSIDQLSVAHKLNAMGKLESVGGASYLSHLINITPTSLHAGHYAGIVKDCAINRCLISVAKRIEDIGESGVSAEQALRQSYTLISKVSQTFPANDILTPRDMANEADVRYGQLRNIGPGMATGIKQFDKRTAGLFNGDYVILAARPGLGKTTLALQIARNMAKELTVLFLSLEMVKSAVMDKLVASLGGLAMVDVRRGNYSEGLLDKIIGSVGELGELNLYLAQGPAATQDLRRLIERMQMSYGLDAVFVDYLQLLRDRDGSNANERVGFISNELSSISKEFNIPLVVLSQLNRAADGREDKRPHLSDLRESGSIEQDADLILFLYRDSYYKRDAGTEAELIIAKDRLRGTSGKIKLIWEARNENYIG